VHQPVFSVPGIDVGLFHAAAEDDEIAEYRRHRALGLGDHDIAAHVARARARLLGVGRLLEQPFGALAQPVAVVIDEVERRSGRAVRRIGRRDEIFAVLGEQVGPFLEPPGVEQGGFLEQKIFGFGAGERVGHGPASSSEESPETSCRQRRQKVRI